MQRRSFGAVVAVLLALLWGGVLLPRPPKPADPEVAAMSAQLQRHISATSGISVYSKGVLKRDRDTFFWSLFTEKFGSNPNTPYMWYALPAFGFGLPSPMWHLWRKDAVVLLARLPPQVTYFSFTTFALWMPRRGLPFSSLGDSVNNLNIKHTEHGLFAHVVTSSRQTFELIRSALERSGLPPEAINLAAIPANSNLGLFEDWTHFETVLRLFRFANQTEGNAYLMSGHPVLYVAGSHNDEEPLPIAPYKARGHEESVREPQLEADFAAHSREAVSKIGRAFTRDLSALEPLMFRPLMILGLECLKNRTECLGDCPDATYFGPNVLEDSDSIDMLSLRTDQELHIVSLVNHRLLNASIYGSIALLRSGSRHASTLSKTHMNIRGTSLGVTSFEWPHAGKFVTWAFTRNPEHCVLLGEQKVVDGCSVIDESHVERDGYLTYAERVYLNPITGTGPDWADLLTARLYHAELHKANLVASTPSPSLFPRLRLPEPADFETFDASEPLRFLHIIKTGGEALEHHLATQLAPRLDFSTCRSAAAARAPQRNGTPIPWSCAAAATGVSAALCGLNCECCAADIRIPGRGFHGTLLRSPRAHVLSQFSHCHVAHHSTWARTLSDVPLYFAEGILRATEVACESSCASSANPDWKEAMVERFAASEHLRSQSQSVRVIDVHNTQAHALTCSKSHGSFGQHFRFLSDGGDVDSLEPPLQEALASLRRFEWVGITDLYEPSLCLLHYQANQTLPKTCDCDSPSRTQQETPLGKWKETRSESHDPALLPPGLLARIDAHTALDSALFAAGLRLLLGRLRRVEDLTGASLLRCIDWHRLHRKTEYIPGLWEGPEGLLADFQAPWSAGDN